MAVIHKDGHLTVQAGGRTVELDVRTELRLKAGETKLSDVEQRYRTDWTGDLPAESELHLRSLDPHSYSIGVSHDGPLPPEWWRFGQGWSR